jgi:hypothetical protein
MPSAWTIDYWPRVGCHVFLSHCAEDRERLVLPVYDELCRRQIIPWIDRHDYPLGRNASEALRDEILRCRHVVYFLTMSALRQGRGWSVMERTLAGLAQDQLIWQGTEFQHVELPLLFVEPSQVTLQRSVWQPLLQRSVSYSSTRTKNETRRDWSVRKIEAFLKRESDWAEDIRKRLRHNQQARNHFASRVDLLRRLRAVDPAPIGEGR